MRFFAIALRIYNEENIITTQALSRIFSPHAGEWELPPTKVETEGCVEAEVSLREHPPTPQSLGPPEEWE